MNQDQMVLAIVAALIRSAQADLNAAQAVEAAREIVAQVREQAAE